jgi:hypothetical protein
LRHILVSDKIRNFNEINRLAFKSDRLLEIVDDSSGDYVEKTGADGKVTRVFNKEHFEDRRRRINARNWTLTHLAPKKYRYR